MDGERIAVLEFGDTVTRDVPPGRHVFRAHNTLVWKTVACDVNPGEHVRFNAVNKPGFGTYAMLGLLGTGPLYLTFEREADQT